MRLAKTWQVPEPQVAIPAPLGQDELQALANERLAAWRAAEEATCAGEPACLGAVAAASPPDPLAGLDLDALAAERAAARGKHLIETRLGCFECHGEDYGGKVVMDVPPVMGMIAPNITPAGVVADFTDADWVRLLRHGVGKDGQASIMPVIDYTLLSDQEIGDVVTYVRSVPPVDRTMPAAYLGPVVRAQLVFGGLQSSAEMIDHAAPRPARPPAAAVSEAYGEHLASVCVGCHNTAFSGGPIVGGDPSWPPAANLTPDPSGIGAWTEADFLVAMREGRRPDGSAISPVMPWRFYAKLSDTDLKAMYTYLHALPGKPVGQR